MTGDASVAVAQRVRDRFVGVLAGLDLTSVGRAAALLADVVDAGGRVALAGSGHSHLAALEGVRRAGGPAWTYAVTHDRLDLRRDDLADGEQDPSLGPLLVEQMNARDGLVVVSHSGRTPVMVELARQARAAGAAVIAVTRAATGLPLGEHASVILPTGLAADDADVEVHGAAVGACSTLASTTIVHALLAEVVARSAVAAELLLRRSGLADAADHNRRVISQEHRRAL